MEDYHTDRKVNHYDKWIQEQIQPLIFSDSFKGKVSEVKIEILKRIAILKGNTLKN